MVEVMYIFKKILGQVRQSIDSSNVVVGEYMCQGKMPQSVTGSLSEDERKSRASGES